MNVDIEGGRAGGTNLAPSPKFLFANNIQTFSLVIE